jgi:hypothetical protein
LLETTGRCAQHIDGQPGHGATADRTSIAECTDAAARSAVDLLGGCPGS